MINTDTIQNDTETIPINTDIILSDTDTILNYTDTILNDTETILINTDIILSNTDIILNYTDTILNNTNIILNNTDTIQNYINPILNAKETNTNNKKPIEYAKETNTNENKPIQINTDIILNKTDSILKTKETNTNNKKPIPNDTASQHWKNQCFVVRQGLHLATFGYICSLNIPPMRKINLFVSLAGLALLAVFMMWIPRPVSEGSLAGTILQLPQAKEPKMHPNDWIGKQKLYPQGQFNHQHYLMALREAAALQQSSTAKGASWTPAGPENIGGRITDIAVDPLNNSIFYVAAATGGIYKTTDDGASWQNVFTNAPVITVGALAIDPSNPQVVWAGTGEANSSSFSFIGNGIYKSTDGGATWQHKGLEQSAYFGRVVVDYSNGNRVFAAATGTLFTPNATRGVYRTTDGGNTWERVLYVNDSCAAIDLVQHPANPDILYAAMWERMRGLTYRRSYGASSGIYKSTDGGTTWKSAATDAVTTLSSAAVVFNTDQVGSSRTLGSNYSMGAVAIPTDAVFVVNTSDDTIADDGLTSLREAIIAANLPASRGG